VAPSHAQSCAPSSSEAVKFRPVLSMRLVPGKGCFTAYRR
jgi:hypothetical protein